MTALSETLILPLPALLLAHAFLALSLALFAPTFLLVVGPLAFHGYLELAAAALFFVRGSGPLEL